MTKFSPKVLDNIVNTAVQLVYEHPGWGEEHVQDMYDAAQVGSPTSKLGYTAEDLYEVAGVAEEAKENRLSHKDVVAYVKERLVSGKRSASSRELRFASEDAALQYLAGLVGKKVKVAVEAGELRGPKVNAERMRRLRSKLELEVGPVDQRADVHYEVRYPKNHDDKSEIVDLVVVNEHGEDVTGQLGEQELKRVEKRVEEYEEKRSAEDLEEAKHEGWDPRRKKYVGSDAKDYRSVRREVHTRLTGAMNSLSDVVKELNWVSDVSLTKPHSGFKDVQGRAKALREEAYSLWEYVKELRLECASYED